LLGVIPQPASRTDKTRLVLRQLLAARVTHYS
jgi:hypothetical protein